MGSRRLALSAVMAGRRCPCWPRRRAGPVADRRVHAGIRRAVLPRPCPAVSPPLRTRPPGPWPAPRPGPGRPGAPGPVFARSRNAAAAAKPPRACARPAERSSSAATVSSGRGAAWARCHAPPVSIGVRIGRLGQFPVRCPPVTGGGSLVDRRADQGMAEAHPGADLDQPGILGICRGVVRYPLQPGRAPQQGRGRVAGRSGLRRRFGKEFRRDYAASVIAGRWRLRFRCRSWSP